MEELLDSDNISVNNYCPLIEKAPTHMYLISCERGTFLEHDISLENSDDSCIVMPGSMSFSVLFLLPLLITVVYPMYHF